MARPRGQRRRSLRIVFEARFSADDDTSIDNFLFRILGFTLGFESLDLVDHLGH